MQLVIQGAQLLGMPDDLVKNKNYQEVKASSCCHGYPELIENVKEMGHMDSELGLKGEKIETICSLYKYFFFLLTLARAALNLYEASYCLMYKLPGMVATAKNVSGLNITEAVATVGWERVETEEEMFFLWKHRFYWVSGIVVLELLVLLFLASTWLSNVVMYLFGPRCNVNTRAVCTNLRRTADFSVLQFAMYASPDILMQDFRFARAWLRLAVRGRCATGDMRKQKRIDHPVGLVVLGVFWGAFQFVGFVAFLTKLSFELGGIVFISVHNWRWQDYSCFLGFISNCAGIVESDRLAKDRLFLFRFAGPDGTWSPRELAVRLKYERTLMRFMRSCLQSKWKTIVFMSTLTAQDLQYLLIAEGGQEKGPLTREQASKPALQNWMFHDSDGETTDEESSEHDAHEALTSRSDSD